MRATLTALVAVLIGVAVPSPASALKVGYNDDPERFVAVPRAVEHSNTDVARVAFPWPEIEPANGRFEWTEVDRSVDLFRRAHIRPIISVFGSPAWAASGGQPGIQCPCERSADVYWTRMWQQLALRYPDAIFNIWNEPNLLIFGGVGVERMVELTNEAARAIWQVSPGRKVIGPPIAPVHDWIPYVRAYYPQLDPRIEMAANVYPYARVEEDKSIDQLLKSLQGQLSLVRRIAGRRELWITETNVSRSQFSARKQNRYIRGAYELARAKGVKGMIIHRLWSAFSAETGLFAWDAGLSALEPDGVPTSLYNQIGRLHKGFKPLEVRPGVPGEGIVVGSPPPPILTPAAWIKPCPESG